MLNVSTIKMIPPRLNLVDGNLELLTAAVAGGGALEALLGVSVADDWAGFPEALPVLRASYAKNPNGQTWGSLFFVDPHVRTLVGFGGFKGPPSSDAVVEIGYAIAPAFRGQGLATNAVAQMVQRAFEDTIVRAVDAHTLGHANPSTRVLEKSGFRKIGEASDPDDGVVWHWRRERPAPAERRYVSQTVAEDVTLREARAADSAFLLSLAREAYREVLSLQLGGWNEAVHGTRFAEKVASLPFWVGELDGEPVAAVSSTLHVDHLRVNELVVLPAFQNRGIGSRLLLRELERARSVGVPVRLHTLRLNRAVQFYERHGFVVTARRDEYIDLERAG